MHAASGPRRANTYCHLVAVDIAPGDPLVDLFHGLLLRLRAGCAQAKEEAMEQIYERVAGCDVHRDQVTVCVRTPGPRGGVHKLSLIHISEPTRQAEISYAVFCLKKKK